MFLENTNSFFKDNDIYYNCRTLDNGWLHITEIPENYIKSNTQVLIKTLLITVIISLPLTIFIVILFSRKLTSRIAALSYACLLYTSRIGRTFFHSDFHIKFFFCFLDKILKSFIICINMHDCQLLFVFVKRR